MLWNEIKLFISSCFRNKLTLGVKRTTPPFVVVTRLAINANLVLRFYAYFSGMRPLLLAPPFHLLLGSFHCFRHSGNQSRLIEIGQ